MLALGVVGGLSVLFGYGVIVLNYTLEVANRIRGSLGFSVSQGQVDWVLVAVAVAFVALPAVACLGQRVLLDQPRITNPLIAAVFFF